MIRAGELREQVTLQAPTQTRGTYGGATITYVTVATVWARKREPVGRNYYAAMQERNEVPVEWQIRWRRDVKSTWRVVYGNQTYEINQAQDPDGHRNELVLYCKEIR